MDTPSQSFSAETWVDAKLLHDIQSAATNRWVYAKMLKVEVEKITDANNVCFAYMNDRFAIAFPRSGVHTWIWQKGKLCHMHTHTQAFMTIAYSRYMAGPASYLPQERDLHQVSQRRECYCWWHYRWRAVRILRVAVLNSLLTLLQVALRASTWNATLYLECQGGHVCNCGGWPQRYDSYVLTFSTGIDIDKLGTRALVSKYGGTCDLFDLHTQRGKLITTYSSEDTKSRPAGGFGTKFVAYAQGVLFGSVNGCVLVWDTVKSAVVYGLAHEEGVSTHPGLSQVPDHELLCPRRYHHGGDCE